MCNIVHIKIIKTNVIFLSKYNCLLKIYTFNIKCITSNTNFLTSINLTQRINSLYKKSLFENGELIGMLIDVFVSIVAYVKLWMDKTFVYRKTSQIYKELTGKSFHILREDSC
jgi:hypothetical protein